MYIKIINVCTRTFAYKMKVIPIGNSFSLADSDPITICIIRTSIINIIDRTSIIGIIVFVLVLFVDILDVSSAQISRLAKLSSGSRLILDASYITDRHVRRPDATIRRKNVTLPAADPVHIDERDDRRYTRWV